MAWSIRLNENYQKLKEETFSSNLMKNLFGGRKSFEDLPIFPGNYKHEYKVLKNLFNNEPPDPIMRGQFRDGRDFFFICYRNVSGWSQRCPYPQLFFKSSFRSEKNDRSWSCISYGLRIFEPLPLPSIIQGDDEYILGKRFRSPTKIQVIVDNEGVVNQKLYNSLSKFILEKGDVNYKIC